MPPSPPAADRTDRWTGRVVAAVWLGMSAAAVGFVFAFGVNFPFMDEWGTIPALAAPRPAVGWLWEPHNEHLLPLPRLVYWAAFRLTGDLRAGMLVSAVGWSILAKLLLDAARAVRGRPSFADAFFPIILLNWSQYENLLMSYQVGYMCSSVLAGLILREVVLGPATTGRVVRVGVYAALLPMCGGHGLVLAGPGILWLAATRRAVGVALAGVAVASVAQYAVADPAPAPVGLPPPTVKSVAVGLLGFGSVGYGLAGWYLWPGLAVVPTIACAAACWTVGRAWLTRSSDRLALLGVTAFAAGAFALAAVIAWGRGRYGAFGVFFPRYAVLSALLPVGFFFLWLTHGGPLLRRWGPAALAVVAVGLLPLNTWLGRDDGARVAGVLRAAEKDLRAGMPVEVVADRTHFLVFNNPAVWADAVEDYARSDLGRVKRVAHLPPVEAVRVAAVERPDGWFGVELPGPRPVIAVRVRVRHRNQDPHRPARFRAAWRAAPGGPERTRDDWLFRFPAGTAHDPGMVVWIDGPLAAFRFLPDADAPGGADVLAVELLTAGS